MPAAFTRQTGEAHWHVLLRARAIENGAFVIAAAQGGLHEDGRETFGHSLIVDPWGRILAEADHDEPGVIVAEIDTALSAAGAQKDPQSQERARIFAWRRLGRAAPRAPGSRILIRFSLICDHDHEFEAWFRSNDDFDTQKKRGFVDCPPAARTRSRRR